MKKMNDSRLLREQKTLETMVKMYCRSHHQRNELCVNCGALLEYAILKLTRCSFGTRKPICSKCPVHCYKHEMRSQVQHVMRYSGARMLVAHPLLAIRHLMDSVN